PPESTTPTSFKTGNKSGVLSNDALASVTTFSINFSISIGFFTNSFAIYAASLATVKMVPSTGFVTDLYATSTPDINPSATSTLVNSVLPANFYAKPRNNCDKITPEFPRAPINKPLTKACNNVSKF